MARKTKKEVQEVVEVVTPEVITEVVSETVVETEVVTETEVKTETEITPTPKVEKNDGVGMFIRKLIGEGLGNKEILNIVHEQYGNKNTTYACVAWYRNKMKKTMGREEKTQALDFITKFLNSAPSSEEIYLAQEELRKYA